MADPLADSGTPRWVKVSGVIAIVVLLIVIPHLLGGGLGGHAL